MVTESCMWLQIHVVTKENGYKVTWLQSHVMRKPHLVWRNWHVSLQLLAPAWPFSKLRFNLISSSVCRNSCSTPQLCHVKVIPKNEAIQVGSLRNIIEPINCVSVQYFIASNLSFTRLSLPGLVCKVKFAFLVLQSQYVIKTVISIVSLF